MNAFFSNRLNIKANLSKKVSLTSQQPEGRGSLERLPYCIFTSHAGEILEVKGLGFLIDLPK
jgi:hypothetical protein